jgi:hypothetical protein
VVSAVVGVMKRYSDVWNFGAGGMILLEGRARSLKVQDIIHTESSTVLHSTNVFATSESD